jgi:phage/plasmid-associated DNA primase
VIVLFNNVFDGTSQEDRALATGEVWEEERQGIINWALEGWARLRRNTQYTFPDSHHQATEEWRAENDTVFAWLLETCTWPRKGAPINGAVEIGASQLYAAYRKWVEPRGFKPVSTTTFGKSLRLHGVQKEKTRGNMHYLVSYTDPAPMGMAYQPVNRTKEKLP